jgi:hypothetical protein
MSYCIMQTDQTDGPFVMADRPTEDSYITRPFFRVKEEHKFDDLSRAINFRNSLPNPDQYIVIPFW